MIYKWQVVGCYFRDYRLVGKSYFFLGGGAHLFNIEITFVQGLLEDNPMSTCHMCFKEKIANSSCFQFSSLISHLFLKGPFQPCRHVVIWWINSPVTTPQILSQEPLVTQSSSSSPTTSLWAPMGLSQLFCIAPDSIIISYTL